MREGELRERFSSRRSATDQVPTTLYVMDISYFSGKVEAYLRHRRVECRRVRVSHRTLVREVGTATGVAQVPAMRLPDGSWLQESSTMIRWLDAELGGPSVYPDEPAERFVALLVEDYCDEWLWRPAMWWRWVPRRSREELGIRIAREVLFDLPIPPRLLAHVFALRQRFAWLEGDGVTPASMRHVGASYREELATLASILRDQPFVGGQRPSIVDFGYFGPMFRHFYCDPDPSEVMRAEAPTVAAWVERMWAGSDASATGGRLRPLTRGLAAPVFDRITEGYLPYLHANARAALAGARRFDFVGGGLTLRGTRTNAHRVACLRALRAEWAALEPPQQAVVLDRLALASTPAAWADETLDALAGPDHPVLPIRSRTLSPRERLGLYLGDTFGAQAAARR